MFTLTITYTDNYGCNEEYVVLTETNTDRDTLQRIADEHPSQDANGSYDYVIGELTPTKYIIDGDTLTQWLMKQNEEDGSFTLWHHTEHGLMMGETFDTFSEAEDGRVNANLNNEPLTYTIYGVTKYADYAEYEDIVDNYLDNSPNQGMAANFIHAIDGAKLLDSYIMNKSTK